MSAIKDLVMPHETVVRKLDRMAREMLEGHYNESTLVLIGVDGQGLEVASALARRLRELSSIDIVIDACAACPVSSPVMRVIARCPRDMAFINL